MVKNTKEKTPKQAPKGTKHAKSKKRGPYALDRSFSSESDIVLVKRETTPVLMIDSDSEDVKVPTKIKKTTNVPEKPTSLKNGNLDSGDLFRTLYSRTFNETTHGDAVRGLFASDMAYKEAESKKRKKCDSGDLFSTLFKRHSEIGGDESINEVFEYDNVLEEFADDNFSPSRLENGTLELLEGSFLDEGISYRESQETCTEVLSNKEESVENNLIVQEDDLQPQNHFEFSLNSKKYIVLNKSAIVKVYGMFNLKVLYGGVEIMGFELRKHYEKVPIYSPRGVSLLTIKNINDSSVLKNVQLENLVPLFGESNHGKIMVENSSTIIEVSKLYDPRMNFVEKHIAQQILPLSNEKKPCIEINPSNQRNGLQIPENWYNISENIAPDAKIMLCGGKGVGKSTLLRFLVNRVVLKYGKVQILDLDPGQSEFTVPGVISGIVLTKPIFGVNYTHLKTPIASILTPINVGHDPHLYLKNIENLLNSLNFNENIPTLINFMGFSHGLGVNLVASAATLVQPSLILQIESKSTKKNYNITLDSKNIEISAKLFKNDYTLNFEHTVLKLPSMSDVCEGWSLEPRQMREMVILAYFGGLMSPNCTSISDTDFKMFEINLNYFNLVNLRGEITPPSVVNANLVALCSAPPLEGGYNCLGWGIVRGVNVQKNVLVLITPENENVLERVDFLVVGVLNLPPSIYMTEDNIKGGLPYVMQGEFTDFGQISKRSLIPVGK